VIEWFDDLKVGMRYKGGEAKVTQDDIKRFAAEFDPQPFHLDEAAAEKNDLQRSGRLGLAHCCDGDAASRRPSSVRAASGAGPGRRRTALVGSSSPR
jgi:acyl dehydratase